MPTIRDALQQARQQLAAVTEVPHLEAQMLLGHVLDVDRAHLIAYPERELSPDEQAAFDKLLARRLDDVPVAYLTGIKGFWDIELAVSPAVLIPRPETEHLVEAALSWSQYQRDIVAADIGTGSGTIAVTFARHAPRTTVYATDISGKALAVARENARRYQLMNIDFRQGHLAQPLIDDAIHVDLLMANLPYIVSDDVAQLKVSKHEPRLALDGGADGLVLVRELLDSVPQVCKDGALILLEIGSGQGQTVIDYAHETLAVSEARIIYDYAGHDRIVSLRWSPAEQS